jgi:hypothetical protein
MKAVRFLATFALLIGFSGIAHAQNGCARLSWGTCDPWVENMNYNGPGTYKLVESMFGVSAPNVGTDTQIRIRHLGREFGPNALPDAWRFDDAGCQAGKLSWNNTALTKLCPAVKGTNASGTAAYLMDTDGSAVLRLVISYDSFTPIATSRYTVSQFMFDQTLSSVGPTPSDKSTCGGVELGETITFDFARVQLATGEVVSLAPCEFDPFVMCAQATWDGGSAPLHSVCNGPVPAEAETWGRVKALYR